MRQVTRNRRQVTKDKQQAACHLLPVTCHVSPVTGHLFLVTCHPSPGLNLDIATGFIQPGTTRERLFFSIRNPGRSQVLLHLGIHICQLVLSRVG